MRVAHITPYFQPKLGYEERYLPKKQKELGCEVCVITSDRYYPWANYGEVASHILGDRNVGTGLFLEDGIPVYRLKTFFEWGAAVFVHGMKKALTDFSPHIVHAHHMLYPPNILVALNKSSLGYRLILDEHMIIDDFPRTPLKKYTYSIYKKTFFPLLSRKADHFIAMTPAVYLWLQKEFKVAKNNVTLSSLGADADFFKPNESDRARYRKHLGLASDEVLVTYAGKLQPDKDIEVMIRGVAPLIKRDARIRVLLLGGGSKEYISRILALAQELKIEKNVRVHPFVPREELAKFYNASDIGVWPGLPSITIIEAMACGLPLVIAESEQTCHLISYNNGFAFGKGNHQEVEGCLQKLIDDHGLRRQMGLDSRRLIEDKISWDKIAQKTLNIYKRILNRKR
jgi:glycosyltransferase involved in cell wall biosynthesis